MATVSMAAGAENAFGNMALQLSPAFRSANQRALHQREQLVQEQKLRELARSDEFSDDESDGVDSDDDKDAGEDDDDERADTFEDRRMPHSALGMTPRRHSPYHRTQSASAVAVTDTIDLDDDLVDVKETMYVPYRQPPRADRSPRMDRFMQRRLAQQQRRQQQQQQTPSPKQGDDWTLVDKSPTFENLQQSRMDPSSNWFSAPC
ncbi:hypothetical protein PybrP1_005180 [[Pythium] brassicae (nom. inval.)]|nr:hypothetical protein PybrP1_005180 [[Pythium] brassicae (nom. inval.)]